MYRAKATILHMPYVLPLLLLKKKVQSTDCILPRAVTLVLVSFCCLLMGWWAPRTDLLANTSVTLVVF